MASILICMILMHVIDDFVLQPVCLSKLKQKKHWEDLCIRYNVDGRKYRHDYLMALMMHSLSWSGMILIPFLLSGIVSQSLLGICFVTNAIIHAIVDDMKANRMKFNLIQDQFIHLLQIAVTFLILLL